MKLKPNDWRGAILVAASLLLGPSSVIAAEYDGNLEKTFTVAPGGKLSLQADGGSIDVATAETNQVQVRVLRVVKGGTKAQADKLFADHEVTFQQHGDAITVVAKARKKLWVSWSSGQPTLQVHYQVSIPRKFEVELETSGGDIRLDDLDGNATLRTSSSSLRLAKVSGRVETSDSGGDIVIQEALGALVARTSSGSIKVQKAGDKVDASNSGGNISVGEAAGDVMARTSSGSITIGAAQAKVNARDSGGDIRVEYRRWRNRCGNLQRLHSPRDGQGNRFSQELRRRHCH